MNEFYFNMVKRIIQNGKAKGNLDKNHVTRVASAYYARELITYEQYETLMDMVEDKEDGSN